MHRRPHVLLIDEQEESLRLNLASLNHVLTLRDMQRQLERLVGFKGEPDLEKAQELLRQMVMSIVDRYDKATWLFFLRRLPGSTLQQLDRGEQTILSTVRIMEAFTAMSHRPAQIWSGHNHSPSASHVMTHDVMKLLVAVQMYAACSGHIEARNRLDALRLVSDDLADRSDDPTLAAALSAYRSRADRGDTNVLAETGSYMSFSAGQVIVDANVSRPGLVSSASPPGEVTSFAAYGRLPAGQHEVRFLLSAAHQDGRLRRLVEAAANNKGSTEAVALLALMHGMTNTTVRNCSEVMMFGYVTVAQSELRRVVESGLREIGRLADLQAVEATVTCLMQLEPSVWPLRPGTALRIAGRDVMVDLSGATRALFDRVASTTRLNAISVGFSTIFEEDLQAAFVGTAWEPPPHFLALRGRSLKRGGRTITDIDAIGYRNGVVLAVSGKATPRRIGVDTGSREDLIDVMRFTTEKLDEWDDRVGKLMSPPRGDNYDFSTLTLVGVLCLPFLPLVEPGVGTSERLPGLPAVTSLDELTIWLSTQ